MSMDEAAVRRACKMWALVAQMEAIKIEVEAMKADGMYAEESFLELSKRVEDIAEELGAL